MKETGQEELVNLRPGKASTQKGGGGKGKKLPVGGENLRATALEEMSFSGGNYKYLKGQESVHVGDPLKTRRKKNRWKVAMWVR